MVITKQTVEFFGSLCTSAYYTNLTLDNKLERECWNDRGNLAISL